jgi:hypothetical protein
MTPEERAAKLRADYEKSTGRDGLAGLEAMALVALRGARLAGIEAAAALVESRSRHRLPCSCDSCQQTANDAAAIRGG